MTTKLLKIICYSNTFKLLFILINILLPYNKFTGIIFAQTNFKIVTIDNIRYVDKLASIAIEPLRLLEIEFGEKENNVGGYQQDKNLETSGVPYAFFTLLDELYVLDWANKSIKKFQIATGKGNLVLDLKDKIEDIIRDFCITKDENFYLLSGVSGKVYKINKKGEKLLEIEGLLDANAIGMDRKGNLIVDFSVQQKILVFSQNGELINTIFLPNDYIYHVCMNTDKENNIYSIYGNEKILHLAKYSLDKESKPNILATFTNYIPTEFKTRIISGKVIGLDENDNVYIEIVIVDEDGVRFSNRIFKLNNEGKIINSKEILVKPYLSPDLPRYMIVYKNSSILSFYVNDGKWIVIKWEI